MDKELEGIEAELRGVQYSVGPDGAKNWWDRNFAHRYIDYRYDVVEERIVRRDE